MDREEALARLGLRLLLRATPLLHRGRRVADWTLLEYSPGRRHGEEHHPKWLCQCVCGLVRLVRVDYLESGKSHSCGKHRKETAVANYTHIKENPEMQRRFCHSCEHEHVAPAAWPCDICWNPAGDMWEKKIIDWAAGGYPVSKPHTIWVGGGYPR